MAHANCMLDTALHAGYLALQTHTICNKKVKFEAMRKNTVEPQYGALALHAGYLTLQTHTICNKKVKLK